MLVSMLSGTITTTASCKLRVRCLRTGFFFFPFFIVSSDDNETATELYRVPTQISDIGAKCDAIENILGMS